MSILKAIKDLNCNRSLEHLPRRLLKLQEESGETAQAYLQLTSLNNPKNKSWEDILEEAVDTAITSLDIALIAAQQIGPIEADVTKVVVMVDKKLKKWEQKEKNGMAT